MNHYQVHLNQDYAERNQHGKILVVGTLVFSLAVGITVPDISGKAIANLGYESITHNAPVFIGDTIYAETKVLETRRSEEHTSELQSRGHLVCLLMLYLKINKQYKQLINYT